MKIEEFVGQEESKKKLAFYTEAYLSGDIFPSIMTCAARGQGKTELMESLATMLREVTNGQKKAMKVNASVIKSVKGFWNNVVLPSIHNRDVTLFIDEAHKLPKDVTGLLLTATDPKSPINSVTYENYTVDFDLKRQTFVYATTEPQQVFHALMNRCKRLDLVDYNNIELGKILRLNAPGIQISDNLLHEDIASTLRCTGRQAVERAKEILSYLKPLHKHNFSYDDWDKLKSVLTIRPLGLTSMEHRALEIFNERPDCSLTRLAATLKMTTQAVRQDVEIFLLNQGLMEITTGGRNITPKGQEYLKLAKAWEVGKTI